MTVNRLQGSRAVVSGSSLIRYAGLAAVGAGAIFIGIQPFHPPDVLESVSTRVWAALQPLKLVMCLLFLLGLAGLYARQAEKTGWLGLIGFLLFSLSWALQTGFVFTEAYILPVLAQVAPAFVASFLGIVNGSPGEMNIGALPGLYMLVGILYLVGGLLFGIATFRARVLPRWAGGLLAVGVLLPLLASSFVLHPLDRIFAVPVGLAIAWLGASLWSRRQERAVAFPAGPEGPQLGSVAAE